MIFPTIFDWLETFAFLRGYPAAMIIAVTAVLVVLFLDWRLALLALIGQYLVASLLYFDLLEPHLAMIKLFTGMFVCLILYWTARQVDHGHGTNQLLGGFEQAGRQKFLFDRGVAPGTLTLRAGAATAALVIVALLALAFSFRLPGIPEDLPYINLAALLLLSLGIAGIIAGGSPLPVGMAVLTFLTGLELYFAALDQSTRLLALLAALDFFVALSTAYLTQRHSWAGAAAMQHD